MRWSLFLDDERFPPRQTDALIPDWLIARNIDDAKYLIDQLGLPHRMSLDHDLGKNQPTGYDFMKWLVDCDLEQIFNLTEVTSFYVHSQNPVGADNIKKLWENYMANRND
jgi:hypothetical protein